MLQLKVKVTPLNHFTREFPIQCVKFVSLKTILNQLLLLHNLLELIFKIYEKCNLAIRKKTSVLKTNVFLICFHSNQGAINPYMGRVL